ncbi:hypothetical protein NA56DRAFT_177620 [Hyaloscypha hepaticicola]|uniref:Uncharacterized protein n=1 Tax=Hyaloscypha hepaticicola TaxID=2082293 RepID=A0A2J6Q202_9HELO|nr:hypothetical protein NA56DRAFT_177620 [Hyaloscypha hepaticicola]
MTRPKVDPDKRQRTAQACESCKRRKQKVSAGDLIECDLFYSSISFVHSLVLHIRSHDGEPLVPQVPCNNGEDYLKFQLVRGEGQYPLDLIDSPSQWRPDPSASISSYTWKPGVLIPSPCFHGAPSSL